ncbi:hypothetical protein [Radiobacillus sp. PE A8.2]|uniref:hypothetical protein n=1 Tax=Radiobacillus sp. PE A8.2 TaxID=3380349 RepID=UPI00388DEBDC
MSKYQIGIVSEGPRDFEMLQSLITHIVGDEVRCLPLQPDLSATSGFGSYGAGWHGVRDWCKTIGQHGGLEVFIGDGMELDLLIIQLDGDVAREQEVNCYKTCPPAQETVNELENWIKSLLNVRIPDKVVFTIPMDNLESWILAAYHADHALPLSQFECITKPDYLLLEEPYKLLKKKSNKKPSKTAVKYRDTLIPLVIRQWGAVVQLCTQAEVFNNNIKQL